jgi:EmrB/QacA subfamily drug resistance transporter
MATVADRADLGLRSERGRILFALLLSIGLIAIDTTVIATVVPSVVKDLGGFAQFPWLFSVYLLAQAVSVPIYSKLADTFGRKPIMLIGIGLFLLGSVLCGAAWSMPALIAFRAVQGLGAGAVSPMSMTIVGDLYSLQERGRIQGYLGSVWGIASVVGPTIGGVFAEWASWRWVFFVNIPLCVGAGWVLTRFFHEKVTRREHRLDYAGSALLTIACTLLILGLLEGGESWAWRSVASVAVLGSGLAFIAAFIFVERRAAEPVLPFWLFQRRVLVSTNAVGLLIGALLLGLTSFVPTFAQEVLGTGPLVAGFALATMTIGWPITSSQSSKLYLRVGFRSTALIGAAVTFVGCILVTMLGQGSSIVFVAVSCFVVGAGLGLVAAPVLIAAQTTVGWSERGVVTGTNMFSRSIGSAIGVAIFGAIANATLGPDDQTPAQLSRAAHHVFLGVFVAAALMLVAVAAMPKVVPEHIEPEAVPAT